MEKGDLGSRPTTTSLKCVGESDCAQQNSGTTRIYDGETNSFENGKQVQLANGRVSDLFLKAERPQIERQSGQGMVDEVPISEGQQSGASYSDCQAESQRLSCNSNDFEDDDLNVRTYCTERCVAPVNSHFIVGTIESEPSNRRDGESFPSEPKWLEHDESVAVWVKWRSKWQAGIRCARADWPLATLRAKPTHDRKKYFVIFFPHNKNYSWADMQLVQPINTFPEPIIHRTYKVGLNLVKDLNVARRFIKRKLVIGMLNIVDQLHTEALIDTARDVMVWKEYAMEASRCSGYSDLGRMLLKLQKMIMQHYINPDWLQHSFLSWEQRCQVAHSADAVELLKEELFDSILRHEINALRDAAMQPALSSEWRTWKHEVIKWFSTCHPISSSGHKEQQICNSPSTVSLQVDRKRPKLEVRRAEAHASQMETSSPMQTAVEIESEFFSNQDMINAGTIASELTKEEDFSGGAAPIESPCSVANRWDEIVVEAGSSELIENKIVEMTPVNVVANRAMDIGNKNRQCIAFIESKGRQCVRWANEGDVFCCVHLASRFTGSSNKTEASPPVQSPMCGGTTVLGTKCKHRSLPGSSFCKKHRPPADTKNTLSSPEGTHKRKLEEIAPTSEATYCKDIVLAGEVESPLHLDPVPVVVGDALHGRNSLIEQLEHSSKDYNVAGMLHCIGLSPLDNSGICHESPRRYTLYCDKHIPSWLKRARNGRSRIIPKEVFTDILRDCHSFEQKLHLHKACGLFYKLFKSIFSLRNPVPTVVQLQWALSEASKDFSVGELLLKLVCAEKERLRRIWGFSPDEDVHGLSSMVEQSAVSPVAIDRGHDDGQSIKCKICLKDFLDDEDLSKHWMENHKKEAQWHLRGYACAICLDSFTNKKLLETHVQDRHHSQFVEQCMLLRCISCGSHFGNSDELWLHVLSVHPIALRLSKVAKQHDLSLGEEKEVSLQKLELPKAAPVDNSSENIGYIRKFVCRFCGLKFDLLPDLGRHHQAAHMGPTPFSSLPSKKGIHYYAYRLKSGRLSHPRFKKGLGAATYRMRNRGSASMKKGIQPPKLLSIAELNMQPSATETTSLGRLAEFQCSAVSKILFSEIQKTKPRPNNHDILAVARSTCCRVSLKASLEGKYGVLPERVYLKAAKLCSEHNIQVKWHQQGFICPRGCKSFKDPGLYSPMMPLPYGFTVKELADLSNHVNKEWGLDECHYVINLYDLRDGPRKKTTFLSNDISFGKEPTPVACVVDEDLLDSLQVSADSSNGQNFKFPMPWESFTYITKPLVNQSHSSDFESLQLGCACPLSLCCPERCDHVYLFDNDYEDAKDIYGKPMHGRFPYDDKGRIILEEGYLVYECNHMCSCNKNCRNRVLQNGIRVKLEVFKTETKGWAVRAGEPILRGTFVCEYVGEVLDEREACKRRQGYSEQDCCYVYKIDAHTNDMSRLIEGQVEYAIDATKYGNVSRFINHSCSPNLVNHQVIVDSMDSQSAHVGLYASRDIASGEELTYNYRYELLPGEGYPCHCGSSNCRGRLY